MKKIFFSFLVLSILLAGIFISCKKEKSCEGCKENNKPPIAIAGLDQVITLPTDSISLDGSASSDPDGTISVWLWTKISGPASFNNKIIFFTGARYLYTSSGDKFDIYDIATNTWSVGILPANVDGASIISVNNTIYVAGGMVNGVLSNQV